MTTRMYCASAHVFEIDGSPDSGGMCPSDMSPILPCWPPPLADALESARKVAADENASEGDRKTAGQNLLGTLSGMLGTQMQHDFEDDDDADPAARRAELFKALGSPATPPAAKAAALQELDPNPEVPATTDPLLTNPTPTSTAPNVETIDSSSHRGNNADHTAPVNGVPVPQTLVEQAAAQPTIGPTTPVPNVTPSASAPTTPEAAAAAATTPATAPNVDAPTIAPAVSVGQPITAQDPSAIAPAGSVMAPTTTPATSETAPENPTEVAGNPDAVNASATASGTGLTEKIEPPLTASTSEAPVTGTTSSTPQSAS